MGQNIRCIKHINKINPIKYSHVTTVAILKEKHKIKIIQILVTKWMFSLHVHNNQIQNIFVLLKLINQIQSIKTEEKQRPFTLLIIYSFSSNEAFNYQLSITSFILYFLSFTATNFFHKKGEQPCFASLFFFIISFLYLWSLKMVCFFYVYMNFQWFFVLEIIMGFGKILWIFNFHFAY